MSEKWINGFESHYAVDDQGNVISYKNNKRTLLVGSVNQKTGYRIVLLTKDKIVYGKLVHRLVAQTLLDNKENKPTVNHINGIKTDNRLDNLEWLTYSEQQKHSISIGLRQKVYKQNQIAMAQGVANSKGLFTLNEADDILDMMDTLKLSCRQTAKLVGCEKSSIQRLKNGITKYFRQETKGSEQIWQSH